MPDFAHELTHGRRHGVTIAGIDEVGRGPLAGPVVAAAVIWPESLRRLKLWQQIGDSKKLTAKIRAALAVEIQDYASCAIAEATVEEIDTINILQASLLAMRRAALQLTTTPALCLIDGNRAPRDFPVPTQTIIGGDGRSLSIAAASIIAKVHRDRIMQELAETHPHYGWQTNAGYGTPGHLTALAKYGPTVHHRRSFAPVRACFERAA